MNEKARCRRPSTIPTSIAARAAAPSSPRPRSDWLDAYAESCRRRRARSGLLNRTGCRWRPSRFRRDGCARRPPHGDGRRVRAAPCRRDGARTGDGCRELPSARLLARPGAPWPARRHRPADPAPRLPDALSDGDAALRQPAFDAARDGGQRSTSTAMPGWPRPRTCEVLAQHRRHLAGQDRCCRWRSPSCSPGSWRAPTRPARGVLEVLITLPFFIPPILTATAWAMLGNAQVGTINLVWRWLTGSDGTLVDVYSYGGVDLAHDAVLDAVHLPVRRRRLPRHGSRRSRNRAACRARRAGRPSGASPSALMLPVTTSAFILSFIRGMESFESAVFFGTPVGINVITTQIYQSDHPARAARLPVGDGAGLRRHGADVPAAGPAEPAAARPQLHHRDRQGLFAQRHAARLDALGDLRGLHRLLRAHRRAADRPAPARARSSSSSASTRPTC